MLAPGLRAKLEHRGLLREREPIPADASKSGQTLGGTGPHAGAGLAGRLAVALPETLSVPLERGVYRSNLPHVQALQAWTDLWGPGPAAGRCAAAPEALAERERSAALVGRRPGGTGAGVEGAGRPGGTAPRARWTPGHRALPAHAISARATRTLTTAHRPRRADCGLPDVAPPHEPSDVTSPEAGAGFGWRVVAAAARPERAVLRHQQRPVHDLLRGPAGHVEQHPVQGAAHQLHVVVARLRPALGFVRLRPVHPPVPPRRIHPFSLPPLAGGREWKTEAVSERGEPPV